MKRNFLLLPSLLVVFSLAVVGCTGEVVKSDQTPTPTPTPTEKNKPVESTYKPEKPFEMVGAFGYADSQNKYTFEAILIDSTTKIRIKDAQINICDNDETFLTLNYIKNGDYSTYPYWGTTEKIEAGKTYTVQVMVGEEEKYTSQVTIPSKINFVQTDDDLNNWLTNTNETNFTLSWNNNDSNYYYHDFDYGSIAGLDITPSHPDTNFSLSLTVFYRMKSLLAEKRTVGTNELQIDKKEIQNIFNQPVQNRNYIYFTGTPANYIKNDNSEILVFGLGDSLKIQKPSTTK